MKSKWDKLRLIEKAALFAERAHEGQVRKYTGEPYIVHPAEVARIVSTLVTADDIIIAAAWLHDVVEDTDVTDADLRREFGEYVANHVWWLTDISTPKDGNRAARKAIDRKHIAGAGPSVQTIKLADLISNTSTITRFDPEFAKVYLAEKRALLEVLTSGNATLHAVATALAKDCEGTP